MSAQIHTPALFEAVCIVTQIHPNVRQPACLLTRYGNLPPRVGREVDNTSTAGWATGLSYALSLWLQGSDPYEIGLGAVAGSRSEAQLG